MSTELTPVEAASLAEHEAVIERGLNTFVEVGTALLAIRDGREYRATHAAFEDYCQQRWGMRRQRANELIAAARVVDEISSTDVPAPSNEAQAVALARIPEPERAEVWRETIERTGGKPTAAAIRETYAPLPAPTADLDEFAKGDDVDLDEGADTFSPLPDGPRYCKYCYKDRDLKIGSDGSLIVCSYCNYGLAPWDQAVEAGGYDAFIDEITEKFAVAVAGERAAAYGRAVTEFPELAHYEQQPAEAIAVAANLRKFSEPELTMRRGILARAMDAEQRMAEEGVAPSGPDYTALADEIFLALNHAAQIVSRNGGSDTVREAIAACPALMAKTWRDQFEDLARTCTALADECAPRLRSLK
jgi:hypothetical protein